jgi:hypothetical protein
LQILAAKQEQAALPAVTRRFEEKLPKGGNRLSGQGEVILFFLQPFSLFCGKRRSAGSG